MLYQRLIWLGSVNFFCLKGMRFLSWKCQDFRENDYAPYGPSKVRDWGKYRHLLILHWFDLSIFGNYVS